MPIRLSFRMNTSSAVSKSDVYKRQILWGVFDRHIGNDKGYYSWNYVAPWQNNKMIGCFETFHVTLIDRDIGELSVPVEYEPGLALAGCDFSNIRANDSVKELIKNTGGVI